MKEHGYEGGRREQANQLHGAFVGSLTLFGDSQQEEAEHHHRQDRDKREKLRTDSLEVAAGVEERGQTTHQKRKGVRVQAVVEPSITDIVVRHDDGGRE